MIRSYGTPSAESHAFMRVEWGEPMTANMAGTTARVDGDDPVSVGVRGMTTAPESLDVRPFGMGAGILTPVMSWLDAPGLPVPGQDFSDAPTGADVAAGGGLFGGLLPRLPRLPDDLGMRVGFGALGLGLALVGVYALVRS